MNIKRLGLLALILIPLSVLGSASIKNFSSEINPTTALLGETKDYTVTVVNATESTEVINSVKIAIPSGFLIDNPDMVLGGDATTGWSAVIRSGTINLKANGSTGISAGNSLSVTFSAIAPSIAGTYTWTTQAFKNRNFSTNAGGQFSSPISQPSVTVQ